MTKYRTNVDCCKQLMSYLNDSAMWLAQPVVGDHITVLSTTRKEVVLEVVRRVWSKNGELICELNLTSYWSHRGMTEFDKFVEGP